MQRSLGQRLAAVLVMMLICCGMAAAQGQGLQVPEPAADPAYGIAGDAAVQGRQVRADSPQPGLTVQPVSAAKEAAPDTAKMAADLADLKKQLKAIQDKDAAAKKKAEGQPSVAIGGLIQWDASAFGNVRDAPSGGPLGDPQNGAKPRRLRLQAAGEAFNNMDYKLELEFVTAWANTTNFASSPPTLNPTNSANTVPRLKDAYFTIRELPYLQNLRLGHIKEPFGLEQMTSDKFTTFMERSMADEGFIVPGRDIGVMAFGWTETERATWAVGGFLNTPTIENPPSWPPLGASGPPAGFVFDDRSQCAVTMRATWLPWYDEATEGRGLWHTGIAYSYRTDEGLRKTAPPFLGSGAIFPAYSVRPEDNLAPAILSLPGNFVATDNQLLGVEQALVYGPLSLQSEFFADFINRPDGLGNVTFTGFYADVSYFLTGENRTYNRRLGAFDRVRPYTNFFRVRTCDEGIQSGWGAWEVAYRFSCADMLDGAPAAAGLGRMTDHTIGLNWYLNPFSRLMFNYVLTTFDRWTQPAGTPAPPLVFFKDGTLNSFEVRAQFDF